MLRNPLTKNQYIYYYKSKLMKTLILICLASVFLLSCQKKYCWKCTWYADGPGLGYNSGRDETRVTCDITEEEANDQESYSKNGLRYNLTGCEKQQ